MDPSRRVLISVMLILGSTLSGTVGYMLIEGKSLADAAYMTIITISTVGFREVFDLSAAGRLFTIVVILIGVGSMYYASVSLVTFFVGGELQAIREKSKVQKRINQLRNHIIVCGYGRMGKTIVSQLINQGLKDLVVIESAADTIADIEKEGLLFVQADASEEDALPQAGIDRARVLVATLPRDSDNVFVALTARELNPALLIITRAESSTAEAKLIRAGADRVVCPQVIGAHRISNLIVRPNVMDFVDVAARGVELEIAEYQVTAETPFAGQTLRDSGLRQKVDAMVIAIRRSTGETLFNPRADAEVLAGDTLILIGHLKIAELLSQL